MNLVSSCMKLLLSSITTLQAQDNPHFEVKLDLQLAQLTLFSVVWSVGAALEELSRRRFSQFLLQLISGDANIHVTHGIQDDLLQLPFVPRILIVKLPSRVDLFELCWEPLAAR